MARAVHLSKQERRVSETSLAATRGFNFHQELMPRINLDALDLYLLQKGLQQKQNKESVDLE